MTKNISLKEAEYILRSTKGKVFSVVFIKKDGSERKLQGRLGVRKNLKGVGSNMQAHKQYITVYEMHDTYKNVNLSTICSVTFGGIHYNVNEDE